MGQGSGIAMSCGVGHRSGSALALLWLWLAAVAPIRPLAWELPYATGSALKSEKIKIKIKWPDLNNALGMGYPFFSLMYQLPQPSFLKTSVISHTFTHNI